MKNFLLGSKIMFDKARIGFSLIFVMMFLAVMYSEWIGLLAFIALFFAQVKIVTTQIVVDLQSTAICTLTQIISALATKEDA